LPDGSVISTAFLDGGRTVRTARPSIGGTVVETSTLTATGQVAESTVLAGGVARSTGSTSWQDPFLPSVTVSATGVVTTPRYDAFERISGVSTEIPGAGGETLKLVYDRDGKNPSAVNIVKPDGRPQRPWFYLIPAKGEPVALMHNSEARNFEHLAGKKLTYTGYRDLDKQMRAMLKGVRSVAIEYSPKAAVPNMSRVDAGTVELVRAAGIQVKSSETLVQNTKAIWGDAGRTSHYVAVHHIVELRKEALAFVGKKLSAREPVTEYDVQQKLTHGMTMRGIVGPPPVVAAGVNSADPYYVPTAAKTATIKAGDVIVIGIAGKVDKPDGVYAAQTWVAVAANAVPDAIHRAFETASLARDQALVLITDRIRKHRVVTGSEVDQATRAFMKKAGVGSQVMHRTGHSIDSDLQGGGADLDDFEVKDTRIMTAGTGFTVGPGLYVPGQFGVRTEVSVYLAPNGPEVTTPAQDDVEALLK